MFERVSNENLKGQSKGSSRGGKKKDVLSRTKDRCVHKGISRGVKRRRGDVKKNQQNGIGIQLKTSEERGASVTSERLARKGKWEGKRAP